LGIYLPSKISVILGGRGGKFNISSSLKIKEGFEEEKSTN